MYSGRIEIRRLSDLEILSSFNDIHSKEVLPSVCELEDGSFVSSSVDQTVKRWRPDGSVLQTLLKSKILLSHSVACKDINSNNNIIVTTGDFLEVWKVSKEECHCTLVVDCDWIDFMVNLSEDKIALIGPSPDGPYSRGKWSAIKMSGAASGQGIVDVRNLKGDHVQIFETKHRVEVMARIDDMVVTASGDLLEIRLLK